MRNRYLLALDLPLIVLCSFLAFALRFDLGFSLQPELWTLFLWSAGAALVVKPPLFVALGMYNRYWRYATVDDLITIALSVGAATLALACVLAGATMLGVVHGLPRSVLMIDGLLTLVTVGGVRLSIRVVGETRRRARSSDGAEARRVLLVGAGEAGTMVAREIRRNPQLRMSPVGFLDDNPAKHGKRVAGLPVLGPTPSLQDLVSDFRIDEVIIAMPTAPGTALRAIAERCRVAGVASRTVPGVFELLDGVVNVSRLRQIEIVDLLRRTPVSAEPASDQYVAGRVVLVTGAGGSIGSELCRQVARARPTAIVLLGHGENSLFDAEAELRRKHPGLPVRSVVADIRDERRMDDVFAEVRPSIVFHAAAHKHVPLMEENPVEALSNNALGTAVVVRCALAHGTERFVLISTDKAVTPSSIMGASKRLAERIVSDAAARSGRAFVAVRFGNVLGSRGSVVPFFKAQIEQGGPVTVTHPEMRRFFMTIPEAVHLVIQAGGMGRGGELFVLKMGDPVRIVDLARDVIELSGCSLDEIPIVFTGVRPGEKLSEHLWEADAVVRETAHPEVLQVQEPAAPVDIAAMLSDVERAVRDGGRPQIDRTLARWVERFEPASASARVAPRDTSARQP